MIPYVPLLDAADGRTLSSSVMTKTMWIWMRITTMTMMTLTMKGTSSGDVR